MTTTFFTINSRNVSFLMDELKSINATPVAFFAPTPASFEPCHCGGTCNHSFGLSAGTKFKAEGKHSRNALTKLLGQEAWVRGVSHF